MIAQTRSGVLVVDKARGTTSFDVVTLVRRVLRQRRVGHAGTLDPEATGVLPVLLGEATKLTPYLHDMDKEYVATVRLGVTTDTQDLAGRVLATALVPELTVVDVATAARALVGRIRQVPPMYSAIHHEGRRLYELARQGVEVAREPREVVVHDIAVEALALPIVTVRVVCGKGTYVRVLAADLGAALGCGGAVERLVRRRVGPFTLADALPASAIAPLSGERLLERVRPPESALAGWPALRLDARASAAFVHGQAVAGAPAGEGGTLVAVHADDGRLLGVGEVVDGGRVRPARILHADHPGPRVLPA